jgi:hypothetical protein
LGHDQFDILVLQTSSIDLLSLVLILVFLGIASLNSLALSVVVVVVVASVIVSGVVMGLLGGQLLSSVELSLGVEILDLGFSEDTG